MMSFAHQPPAGANVSEDAIVPDAVVPYVWPQAEYYASAQHKLLYAPIPKVACTSLKLWWASLLGKSPDAYCYTSSEGKLGVEHGRLNDDFKYHHHAAALGTSPLDDANWFRFAFVRNPWARLVSAYVNKFLELHAIACEVMHTRHVRVVPAQLRQRAGQALRTVLSFRRSEEEETLRPAFWPNVIGESGWYWDFTFRHFVAELAESPLDDGEVDLHWRPQYRTLGDTHWNFIGRLETFHTDFAELTSRLSLPSHVLRVNQTEYAPALTHECYADWPLHALRRLKRIPDYREFYSPKLIEQVATLYHRDVKQFGYDFDEQARSAA
jgi:hypothetical protein